jgi:hypothetical protein
VAWIVIFLLNSLKGFTITLYRLLKKSFGCHSERREESQLLDIKKILSLQRSETDRVRGKAVALNEALAWFPIDCINRSEGVVLNPQMEIRFLNIVLEGGLPNMEEFLHQNKTARIYKYISFRGPGVRRSQSR